MADEHILYQGRIPFRVFHFSHGLLWMLILGWNLGLIISWLQSLNHSIRITSQRLVLIHGLVAQREEEVEFYRVQDTQLEQKALQRLANVGTLTLLSDDVTAPELTFSIHTPHAYRDQIRTCIREQRKEMVAIQVD